MRKQGIQDLVGRAMVDADFKVSMRESNAGEYSPER